MAKKVLICEDNPANRVLIRSLIALSGHEIIEAVNGLQAIELATFDPPDLIIMDIQMPVMNGYDTIKALRQNPATSGIFIIATTSFAMVGDREKILEAGANEYMSKPIDTREFRKLVKKYLALD
jgi:two-component system cell cycle response regulator DivK